MQSVMLFHQEMKAFPPLEHLSSLTLSVHLITSHSDIAYFIVTPRTEDQLGPCRCTVSSKLLKNSDDFKLFSLSTASAYHQKADQDRTTHAYTIGQEMTVSKSMVKPPLINVGMMKAKLSLKGILNQ